jgi:hypothetical protein
MQGRIVGDTMVVMDSFALPVEGTETRVNAHNEANEYMVQYTSLMELVCFFLLLARNCYALWFFFDGWNRITCSTRFCPDIFSDTNFSTRLEERKTSWDGIILTQDTAAGSPVLTLRLRCKTKSTLTRSLRSS